MVRGKEVIRGFVPTQLYTVRLGTPELKQSASGFEMAVFECEILGPDTVEAAGRTYKTAGAKGSMYIMLNNKNGVDSAIEMLSKPLEKLGLLADIPEGAEYGINDVKDRLARLDGKNITMIVSSETVYVTNEQGKGADRDPAKAVRDPETNEPLVKSYSTRFDFQMARAIVASPSDF